MIKNDILNYYQNEIDSYNEKTFRSQDEPKKLQIPLEDQEPNRPILQPKTITYLMILKEFISKFEFIKYFLETAPSTIKTMYDSDIITQIDHITTNIDSFNDILKKTDQTDGYPKADSTDIKKQISILKNELKVALENFAYNVEEYSKIISIDVQDQFSIYISEIKTLSEKLANLSTSEDISDYYISFKIVIDKIYSECILEKSIYFFKELEMLNKKVNKKISEANNNANTSCSFELSDCIKYINKCFNLNLQLPENEAKSKKRKTTSLELLLYLKFMRKKRIEYPNFPDLPNLKNRTNNFSIYRKLVSYLVILKESHSKLYDIIESAIFLMPFELWDEHCNYYQTFNEVKKLISSFQEALFYFTGLLKQDELTQLDQQRFDELEKFDIQTINDLLNVKNIKEMLEQNKQNKEIRNKKRNAQKKAKKVQQSIMQEKKHSDNKTRKKIDSINNKIQNISDANSLATIYNIITGKTMRSIDELFEVLSKMGINIQQYTNCKDYIIIPISSQVESVEKIFCKGNIIKMFIDGKTLFASYSTDTAIRTH